MRICYFTDTYEPQVNGVVTAINGLVKEISKKNKVVIFAPGNKKFDVEEKNSRLSIIRVPSVEFYPYPGYKIAKPYLRKIHNFFDRFNFDIVHIQTPASLGIVGLGLAKIHHIPTVATYHTLIPEYFPHLTKYKGKEIMKFLGEILGKKYTTSFYSRVDITITPSKEIAKILKKWGVKNVISIPNGIDLKHFSIKISKSDARRKLKLPLNKKIFLYLGRISFEKKLEILLKAFTIIEKRYNDVLLVIAGDGPQKSHYEEFARKLKLRNVLFLGYVEDKYLPLIYKSADFFVSPSPTETQGLTFIEAMVCGLPLIGVNAKGSKEIITENKCGLLARSNSPYSLANKMQILLENKKLVQQFRKTCIRRSKYYSIENTGAEHLKIYKKLLKSGCNESKLCSLISTLLEKIK
jgi:glycosyltransferase involved in cell wall biosynthesis